MPAGRELIRGATRTGGTSVTWRQTEEEDGEGWGLWKDRDLATQRSPSPPSAVPLGFRNLLILGNALS